MSRMRYEWTGRPFLENGGSGVLTQLHTLGNPYQFLEQLQEQSAPGFPRDSAAGRWRLERAGANQTDLHVAGVQRHQYWPEPIPQLLADILLECLVHGFAALEWNVLEEKQKVIPSVMQLPVESLTNRSGVLYQQLKGSDPTRLARGQVIRLSIPVADRIRSSLEDLVRIAKEDRRVMSMMPAAVMGKTKVNVTQAFRNLQLETLKVTRDFGFIPIGLTALTEEYWMERRFRAAETGYAIRQDLVRVFNDFLKCFQEEEGMEGTWRVSFEERFRISELRAGFRSGLLTAAQVRAELDYDEPPAPRRPAAKPTSTRVR